MRGLMRDRSQFVQLGLDTVASLGNPLDRAACGLIADASMERSVVLERWSETAVGENWPWTERWNISSVSHI